MYYGYKIFLLTKYTLAVFPCTTINTKFTNIIKDIYININIHV